MGKIYIAGYEIFAGEGHAYLVYDPNENLNSTNDQLIIRGGPQFLDPFPPYGIIDFEVAEISAESLDGLDNLEDADDNHFPENDKNEDGIVDTWADRHYTTYSGWNDSLWNTMVANATELAKISLGYNPVGPNSNSVINTILNLSGIDFRDVLPVEYAATAFPGHLDLLDSALSSSYTA